LTFIAVHPLSASSEATATQPAQLLGLIQPLLKYPGMQILLQNPSRMKTPLEISS
jgi:hypothetical protein